MYCTACGVKNSPESNFCKQCGHKIDRPAPVKISEEAFDRALPEEEQVSALLERAYRLRAEGDVEGAIALCREALELKAESTSAHSLLGQLYAQQGERDQAVQEYERVLQLNPGSIADRVKLDELRATDETGVPAMTGRPRIVLTEQKFTPESARNGLTMAALAIILMMAGGAFALKFWPQPAATASSPNKDNVITAADVTQQSLLTQPKGLRPSETERVAQSTPPGRESTAFPLPLGSGVGSLFSHESAVSAPQSRPNPSSVRMASTNLPPTGIGVSPASLNVKEVQNPPNRPTPTPKESGNRVFLPGDEEVTDDGNGKYSIRVTMGKNDSNTGGGGKQESQGNGGSPPAPQHFGDPPPQ